MNFYLHFDNESGNWELWRDGNLEGAFKTRDEALDCVEALKDGAGK